MSQGRHKRMKGYWISTRTILACISLVAILVASLLFYCSDNIRWRLAVSSRLDPENISRIEFQPHLDWPMLSASTRQAGALVDWLKSTRSATRLRSAPPKANCKLTVHLKSGQTEVLEISPLLPARRDGSIVNLPDGRTSEARTTDIREDVRVRWRGMLREGASRQKLVSILAPDMTTSSTNAE